DTLTAVFNDLDSVQRIVGSLLDQIAAIILEPVAGNMGVVPPQSGFLQGLRELCTESGIVLIFDEVMSGFRVAPGGAQALYGVRPDLTTLGKIIGGGLPVGAYGGRAEIMDCVSPLGPVYQAGTLSGNPLAATAGYVTLQRLLENGFYDRLEQMSATLEQGLLNAAREAAVSITINRVGSMLTVFFTDQPVTDYESALKSDTTRFATFFRSMLKQGVFLPPSQFEALFVSSAHSEADVQATVAAAIKAFSTTTAAADSCPPDRH
ncbi:MAG TPA: aminotransferase class III-fold pyridoxal phosphate-dependent enzyme, partial [bacterium]|nr:aminotransferase class III-fold pyridoxal phosphate-dependent enzyme [bacterium]